MTKEEYEKLCKQLGLEIDCVTKPSLEDVKIMIYKKHIEIQLELASKILKLANIVSQKCKGDMSKNLPYICKLTLLRQMKHMRTLIVLAKNLDSDANLIARSMFEGVLYFFYLAKDAPKMEDWRLYSCVEVQKNILAARNNGEVVPVDLIQKIAPFLEKMDKSFKKDNGEYFPSWKKKLTIKEMAESVNKFSDMYINYYQPLSGYHHWGHDSLGSHYQINESNEDITEVVNAPVMEYLTKSMNLAFSSLFSMVEAAISVFKTGDEKLLQEIKSELNSLPFTKIY